MGDIELGGVGRLFGWVVIGIFWVVVIVVKLFWLGEGEEVVVIL